MAEVDLAEYNRAIEIAAALNEKVLEYEKVVNDLGDLLKRLGLGEPVWPCPTYVKDVAVVALLIHQLREREKVLMERLREAHGWTGQAPPE